MYYLIPPRDHFNNTIIINDHELVSSNHDEDKSFHIILSSVLYYTFYLNRSSNLYVLGLQYTNTRLADNFI